MFVKRSGDLNMSRTSHDYVRFAGAYSKLGIENTYYLAFRDLPALIGKYCQGNEALDHGCGAGRSSRFLKELGLSVTGVDISQDMIQEARERDPSGTYQLLQGMDLPFKDSSFDLVFQSCVAIEIPSRSAMDKTFSEISRVLKDTGIAVVVTGNAEQCIGEWSSFIFTVPKDSFLQSGGQVELLIRGTEITLYDYVWFHSDFEDTFKQAGLIIEERHQPMITGSERYQWYQELSKPFWDIYVLRKNTTVR
jgi:ubiquinone/menaquinone biosynthesis C-methylase UbiE